MGTSLKEPYSIPKRGFHPIYIRCAVICQFKKQSKLPDPDGSPPDPIIIYRFMIAGGFHPVRSSAYRIAPCGQIFPQP
jgi:hypothetical protein